METGDHIAVESYVGCPHCGGPVEIAAQIARAKLSLVNLLSEALEPASLPDVQRALDAIAIDAIEETRRLQRAAEPDYFRLRTRP